MYEEAYPFAVAWKFWRWGAPGITLNPDFFHYPALTCYLQFALQAAHYGIGHLTGAYHDLAAFQKAYEQDPTLFITLARGLSAVFDIGTILLLYAVVSRWFGSAAGLVASLVLALNPLFITEAQIVNVDTPMTFFALLAFYFITRLDDAPELRWYILAGVATGLAAGSKYNGVLMVAPLLLAHFWRKIPTEGERGSNVTLRLLLALGASAVVFIILNPYILLHASQFLIDFSYEQRHMATGHLGVEPGRSSLLWYLTDAFPRYLGWPFLFASVCGILIGAVRKDRRLLLAMVFPVFYLCVIGSWEMRAERYILPVMPFLLLFGSVALVEFWETISVFTGNRTLLRSGSLAALLLIVLAWPVSSTLSYHRSLALPDTRTQAREWIMESLPQSSAIVTGPFGISIPKERYTSLLIPFTPTGSEALAPFYDPRWYEDMDLLIASDYDYGRFLLEPERYKEVLAQYARLRSAWRMEKEFKPAESQNGPTIWLYRPPPTPAGLFDASLFHGLSTIAETSLVVQFSENLASALFAKGKLEKCGQMLDASLALAPKDTRLANSFAWALFKESRYREALGFTKRSLAASVDQAEMLALTGSVLLRTGDDQGAERELLLALAKNARMEIPYLDLELLYRKRNDRENQIGILRRYLAILPAGSENARKTESYLTQLERP